MLPLFPLPNVVLFPKAFLPLHVFEHRYRAMVRDVLHGDRRIGMVVLRPGWQAAAVPPVYATGCAGTIVQHEELPDGRYNIVLRGTRKFSVRTERLTRPYREAEVDWMDEVAAGADVRRLRALRHRLDALLFPVVARGEARVPSGIADDELVNAVSQGLDIDIVEKLALLEKPDVVTRALVLIERLERLWLERDRPGGTTH